MWNITVLKEKNALFYPQYEDFHDAIREAQRMANEKNAIVSVYKKGGHYSIVHPKRKETKCSTS